MAKLTGKTKYLDAVRLFCDSKVAQQKTPKGLLFLGKWGPSRYAANVAFICLEVTIHFSLKHIDP